MKRRIIYLICVLLPSISFAQSDFEKVLKGGEILVNGLSFFKGNKSSSNSKTIESLCVKNKLADKITFKIVGQDEDGTDVKKELVIQKDCRECFLELPKGIYTYEILLSSKEVFKKGEYKIDDETIVTVKQE